MNQKKYLEKLIYLNISITLILLAGYLFFNLQNSYDKLPMRFVILSLIVLMYGCITLYGGIIRISVARNSMLSLVSVIICTILLELGLSIAGAFEERDLKWETSQKISYLNDILIKEKEAYFYLDPRTLLNIMEEKGEYVRNPKNAIVVYTTIEESGVIAWKTDKNGYRNDGHYDKSRPVDLFLLGDSFTEGCCVKGKDTIASNIFYDNASLNIINGGTGGAGLPFMVTNFLHLGLPLKPKYVVINILEQASVFRGEFEITSPIVNDSVINGVVSIIKKENQIKQIANENTKKLLKDGESIVKAKESLWSKINNLRILRAINFFKINFDNQNTETVCSSKSIRERTSSSISLLNRAIREYGGTLIIGYISDIRIKNYLNNACELEYFRTLAYQNEWQFIDYGAVMVAKKTNPREFFASIESFPGMLGHLNASGYKLMAKEIQNIMYKNQKE